MRFCFSSDDDEVTFLVTIECFHSRDQGACFSTKTKESVCIRIVRWPRSLIVQFNSFTVQFFFFFLSQFSFIFLSPVTFFNTVQFYVLFSYQISLYN